jgi:2-C-methyl-D-erythritol 4-phosphate cytidylyltransferase
MKTTALIIAAGSGARYGGDIPKQYRLTAGRPILSWTVSRFEKASTIDEIVIVAAEDYLLHVNNTVVDPYGFLKVTKIVPGGATRSESVWLGLQSLPESTSYVAVHDGVRPLVKNEDIDAVVREAQAHRAAVLGRPAMETVKRAQDGMILATLDRNRLYMAETPQAFQYDLIMEAYRTGIESNANATDDAGMVEKLGFMVRLVLSTGPNPKLTTSADSDFIQMFLEKESNE